MKHHLPNGTFRNNAELGLTHASLANVAKWKWAAPKVKPIVFPAKAIDKALLASAEVKAATWIGHASFLVQYQGFNIITDPHFSDRASPSQQLGPKRTTPAAIALADLPHIDVVVLSHDHYDHLDEYSVTALCRKQGDRPPLFLVPLGIGAWLSKRGIRSWRELDWWQSCDLSTPNAGEVRFTAVPVQHFSGRGLKPNNTLWAGFVVEYDCEGESPYKLFFAGDTGYSQDFTEIGAKFGAMDLSLIPIGAYEPRWFMREMHVNPDEAVQIHLDVNSKRSLAMHWGSFILTDEPMDEPPKQLALAKQKYGLADQDFVAVMHGETIHL